MSPFQLVVHMPFYCEISIDFYKVNVIVTNISRHLLDWNNFGLLDYPDIFFFEYQIWPWGFWGMLVCSSLIALSVLKLEIWP